MGRVLLDCDGVLGDFVGTLLHKLNLKLGCDVNRDDVTEFDMRAWLNKEQHEAAIEILDGPAFARYLEPIQGAQKAITHLNDLGHEVFVVTSPWVSNRQWEYDRRWWLKMNLGIKEDHVISTTAKYLVDGDVFVDDRPKHVRQWTAEHKDPIKKAWLFRQEHNRGQSELPFFPEQKGMSWTTEMAVEIHKSIRNADYIRTGGGIL